MSSLQLTLLAQRQAGAVLVHGIPDAHVRVLEVYLQLRVVPTIAADHPTDKAADQGTAATRHEGVPDRCTLTDAGTGFIGEPVFLALPPTRLLDLVDELLDVLEVVADLSQNLAGVVWIQGKIREVFADLLRRGGKLIGRRAVPGLQDLLHCIIEVLLDAAVPAFADQCDSDVPPALGDVTNLCRVGPRHHLLEVVESLLSELRTTRDDVVADFLSLPRPLGSLLRWLRHLHLRRLELSVLRSHLLSPTPSSNMPVCHCDLPADVTDRTWRWSYPLPRPGTRP
ncbi:hypothetical protein EST92_19090 [Streptomyces sp. TM32]|nr:hypothetical protein EST92_19090 [Streptomyces sp. TM32]